MNTESKGGTRREFLKKTGAVAASMALAAKAPAQAPLETLAINGGPKAVTAPHDEAIRWPQYGQAEEQAVLELVRRPSYAPIAEFENAWREAFGFPYAKAHFNGTSALTSMYFALNLPPGSEILVPSYTFFATIMPMRLFGLAPVFVDIDPRTLNLDLEDAKKRLTKDTKAILPVHWIGLPCDMDLINDWAAENGLIVIEDAAHAHGAKLKDKYMGNWSRMAIFSFQMSKTLPAIEGGMGIYQNEEDYDRANAFGDYQMKGMDKDSPYLKYMGSGLGLKLRMHPMAAALALSQLKGLQQRNAAGAAQVRKLNDALVQLPGLSEQANGRKDMQRVHYAWNMLFIDEAKSGMTRDQAVKALQAEGVQVKGLQYTLQHKCAVYSEQNWWHHKPVIPELPGSEKANATSLALPYFKIDSPELVQQYVKAFEKVWAHRDDVGKIAMATT